MAKELKLVVRMRDLVTKAMGRVRGGLGRIRKAMSAPIGGPLASFLSGAALAGVATAMLLTAANFEAGMNRVRGITQASDEDMARLTKTARELGATTKFSASEAADGMAFLAQAGFKTNEIVGAMPGVLDLASASNLDLATTADIASNILTGFGLSVDQLSMANDTLLTATTNANVNLVQMGEAMKFVGPVAAGVGLEFTEAAAAIALMGNAGIQGTMAGTSLRGALTRLINPTKQETKAMNKLGITAKDSTGKLLPLNQIVGQMEAKLKAGMSQANLTALAMELFGDRAGPAMVALVSQGSAALIGLNSKMKASEGITKRTAEIMNTGLLASLRTLKSAWEELSIALFQGGALAGAADGVDFLAEKIRDVAAAIEAGAIEGTLFEIFTAIQDWGDLVIEVLRGVAFWPVKLLEAFDIADDVEGTLNEIFLAFQNLGIGLDITEIVEGTLNEIFTAIQDWGDLVIGVLEGVAFWPMKLLDAFDIGDAVKGTLDEIFSTFSSWSGAIGGIFESVIFWPRQIINAFIELGDRLRQAILPDIVNSITDWLIDRLSAIPVTMKQMVIDPVINLWKGLAHTLVGASIIPDMVVDIGTEMNKLPGEMIPPTENAVLGVLAELKKLERPRKGKKVSTKEAGFAGLDQIIRVSENAATSIMLPIERANFRFAQQMDEFQKNAAKAMKAGLITQEQVNVLEAQLQATHNARIEQLEQQHLNQLKVMTQQAVNDQLTPLEQLNIRFEEQMARFNQTAALALQQGIITEQEIQVMREQIVAAHNLKVEEMNRTHWEQILVDTQNVQETMREDMRNFSVDVAQAWTDSLADMIAGTAAGAGDFKRAVGKLLAGMVSQWGQMMVLRGFASIAAGLFPPDPVALAAGGKQIAAGVALKAFASSLGGGAGGVGGGRGGGGGGGRGRAPGAAPGRESTPEPDRQAVVRIDVSELSDEDIVTNVPGFVGLLVDKINEGAKREIRLDFQRDTRPRREG